MVNAPERAKFNLDLDGFLRVTGNRRRPLIVPLSAALPIPKETPHEIFSRMHTGPGFILESMEGSERIARYSFIGLEPELLLTFGEGIRIEGGGPMLLLMEDIPEGDMLAALRAALRRIDCAGMEVPRFFGGLVGYISYDLVFQLFDTLRRSRRHRSRDPLAQFMLVRDSLVFDHRAGMLHIFSSPLLLEDSSPEEEYFRSVERIHGILERLESSAIESGKRRETAQVPLKVESPVDREEFCRLVKEMKERIFAGEIFQGVLSRKIKIKPAGNPISIYGALRRLNPSPYMYLLDFGEMQVVGASPEMLLRVEGNEVTTVPIAGTRPRGRDREEDELLAAQLLSDVKELAEHAMLVDLARNDVGRVSRYGSVRVEDYMSIERFSHVQHIVSIVKGTLQEGRDAFDALRACFPAGTVTGAPKIRAMQLIEELEPESRGLYAGAVGYAGFDRCMEFAITIRTIVLRNGHASVQVGAGIVADSEPVREWEETANKAAAMLEAIRAEEEPA